MQYLAIRLTMRGSKVFKFGRKKRYLTVKEVSERLDCSVQNVYRLIGRGEFSRYDKRNITFIPEDEVDDYDSIKRSIENAQ
jgi:excisionase family DNA binding protein